MNEYPTEEELDRIRNWDGYNWNDLIDFIHDIWWPQGAPYGWNEEPGKSVLPRKNPRRIRMSTGGWSGNEEIIDALRHASGGMFWAVCWVSSVRGGHYAFEVADFAPANPVDELPTG